MTIKVLIWAMASAWVITSAQAAAPAKEVCRLIAKERLKHTLAAYLIDEKGQINRGPIAFGTFNYRPTTAEFNFHIPTRYRLVTSTRWMMPFNTDLGGSLNLERTTAVCDNSNTYAVAVVSRAVAIDLLPWHENVELNGRALINEDPAPTSEYEQEIVFRFQARIVGDIVEQE